MRANAAASALLSPPSRYGAKPKIPEPQYDAEELLRILSRIVATSDGNITREIVEGAFRTAFDHRNNVSRNARGEMVFEHIYTKTFDTYFGAMLYTSTGNLSSAFTFSLNYNKLKTFQTLPDLPCINRPIIEHEIRSMGWTQDPNTNGTPYYSPHSSTPNVIVIFSKTSPAPKVHLKLTASFGPLGLTCLSGLSIARSVY